MFVPFSTEHLRFINIVCQNGHAFSDFMDVKNIFIVFGSKGLLNYEQILMVPIYVESFYQNFNLSKCIDNAFIYKNCFKGMQLLDFATFSIVSPN